MIIKLAVFLTVILISGKEILAQSPEIVNEILPEVQPVGGTARLNCTIARLGENIVAWSFDNGKAISTQDTIVGINRKLGGKFKYEIQIRQDVDRVIYMLIIRRLVQTDAGRYRCKVRIQGSNIGPEKTGQLTVQVAPTIDSDADAVKELDQLQDAELRCSAAGIPSPNITWTRSDGGLLPILPKPVAQFRGANLKLSKVNVNHMGVYRCVADNNIKPPSEHLCEVLVFHAPLTRVVQNSYGQAKNRRLTSKLECIVQGHPVPTVNWWRMVGVEKKYITDDDHYEIHKQTQDNQNLRAMEQWYTLKIKNVQASDFTTYICEGSNKMGNHSSNIVLFETTECQGANCPSLSASGDASQFIPSFLLLSFFTIFAYLSR